MQTLFYLFNTISLFLLLAGNSNIVRKNLTFPHNIPSKDSSVTVSISAVGDLMCHSVQYNYAKVSPDSFNFDPVYKFIKPYLVKSDLIMGNLETVTAGKSEKYSGYPLFNTPDEYIEALKNAGFNLITTANNHALDRGETGVIKTITQLKKYGINYEGTFTSSRDQDSIRIYNLKGIKVAVLAYTYGTNGNEIPDGKNYLINIIDTTKIKNNILQARNNGAEIVIVYFHYGIEYKRTPSKFQKLIAEKTIKYGADIILGGHPHVIEPAMFFKTHHAKLDTGFIIYSLGNFISNQRWRYSDAGVILTINITKDIKKDSLFISSVNYIPTWVYKGETAKGKRYYILPDDNIKLDTTLKFLTKSDSLKMQQAFEDTRAILNKDTNTLKIN